MERASKLGVNFFDNPLHRSQIEDWLNRMKAHPVPKGKPAGRDDISPLNDHSIPNSSTAPQ